MIVQDTMDNATPQVIQFRLQQQFFLAATKCYGWITMIRDELGLKEHL